MTDFEPLTFPGLTATLKAGGESTRLRILVLLAEAELTVSDLTEILRQSQPRLSRHLRLLAEARLVERFREGSWAFFRLADRGSGADIARMAIARLDPDDPVIDRDRERLAGVRAARVEDAQNYFRSHAAEWDRIRKLHIADTAVEDAIRTALADKPIRSLLDLGTGTGRMLELFAPDIERGLGLDLTLDMLALARARLDRAGLKHCTVRQGDIYDLALPRDSFDVVIIHQVLHFLDDSARAIREAARVLRPGGRLLVVDFAPHDLEFLREEHAHRRLGFANETVTQWLEAAGLDVLRQQTFPPGPEGKIAVSLWLARDPRIVVAAPAAREVA
ncbi:MAG TPA: metalloregulator ArsR/SmtB family transcription factor [Xanthobacteraceae bacterium]|jgi:ubiquinone/menaquinone biosynthesis C-methylase UbiE|nr:metalloregulator ArsR/SmtB family transcription factor [Xanthobacteraceae bacterium]